MPRFWAYCNSVILSSKPPRCKHFLPILPIEWQVKCIRKSYKGEPSEIVPRSKKAAAQKVQRLCGVSPHSQRSEMIHHIPGRLIRPSRCSNTISMVFSFQTVRFSRTAPLAKTEAASSSCRRPKGRAAAQGLETWKVCSFRFFPSRLLPGAGLPYIRTSPPQDCKHHGGKYWEESIQIVSIAQGQHSRPLSHRCAMPDSPFCRCATSSPGRGKSALKVGALGSPRKLHLFAKASPFGRGVTVGDGEGEPAEIIRSCRMPLRPLPVKKLLRNARRRF